jgi:hypothetical protein
LLIVGKDMRDRPGWGAWLWWATKITPVIAVPCLIWLAWIQRVTDHMWALMAMMLFVVIAVPIKVRQRRNRIAGRVSANPLA